MRGKRDPPQGRTMVRARNRDSRTDSAATTASAINSEPRCLRTVRVKSRSLSVTSTSSRRRRAPRRRRPASVRAPGGFPSRLSPRTCGRRPLRPGLARSAAGSTKSSSGSSPTSALKPRSSARATSLVHFGWPGRAAGRSVRSAASCRSCSRRRGHKAASGFVLPRQVGEQVAGLPGRTDCSAVAAIVASRSTFGRRAPSPAGCGSCRGRRSRAGRGRASARSPPGCGAPASIAPTRSGRGRHPHSSPNRYPTP